MYEFTSGELDQMVSSIREAMADLCSFDIWIDRVEDDLKPYLEEKVLSAFHGYVRAVLSHLDRVKGICFSKEYSLDL